MRTITFWQKVANGEIVSTGGIGQVEVSFVTQGQIAELRWNLPSLTCTKKVKAKTKPILERDLLRGNAWMHALVQPKKEEWSL
jgi:hypothetical protein